MRALFGQGGVVDDQDAAGTADEALGLTTQDGLKCLVGPGADGDEVMGLGVLAGRDMFGEGLEALALEGREEATQVEWTPSPSSFVPEDSSVRTEESPQGKVSSRHGSECARSVKPARDANLVT